MIHDAKRITAKSLEDHEPVAIYLLYSGGHDSLVSTHLSHEILSDLEVEHKVLHIDTTVGVPENEDFVRESAEQFGWDLRIIRNDEHRGKSYEEWVMDEGFPTVSDHQYVYAHLKREAVRQVVREEKEDRFDRVLFLTGVYAGESDRRAGFHQVEKRTGAQVWLNPCFHASDADMARYRRENDLPVNRVAAELGKSGECLCNAFGEDDLQSLRHVCPALAKRIKDLDEKTTEAGFPWGWEAKEIPKRWKLEKEGQQNAFQPLCTDCQAEA